MQHCPSNITWYPDATLPHPHCHSNKTWHPDEILSHPCCHSNIKLHPNVTISSLLSRVKSREIGGVVGGYGVEGVNENGQHLVDICAERGLFLWNTFYPYPDSCSHMGAPHATVQWSRQPPPNCEGDHLPS